MPIGTPHSWEAAPEGDPLTGFADGALNLPRGPTLQVDLVRAVYLQLCVFVPRGDMMNGISAAAGGTSRIEKRHFSGSFQGRFRNSLQFPGA